MSNHDFIKNSVPPSASSKCLWRSVGAGKRAALVPNSTLSSPCSRSRTVTARNGSLGAARCCYRVASHVFAGRCRFAEARARRRALRDARRLVKLDHAARAPPRRQAQMLGRARDVLRLPGRGARRRRFLERTRPSLVSARRLGSSPAGAQPSVARLFSYARACGSRFDPLLVQQHGTLCASYTATHRQRSDFASSSAHASVPSVFVAVRTQCESAPSADRERARPRRATLPAVRLSCPARNSARPFLIRCHGTVRAERDPSPAATTASDFSNATKCNFVSRRPLDLDHAVVVPDKRACCRDARIGDTQSAGNSRPITRGRAAARPIARPPR